MNNSEYRQLLRYARLEMHGRKSIFNAVNVFDPEDLVHDFYLSPRYENGLSPQFLRRAFDCFIGDKLLVAKNRKRIAPTIVNSQNLVLGEFADNYKDDDLIDGYIYRNTGGEMRCI